MKNLIKRQTYLLLNLQSRSNFFCSLVNLFIMSVQHLQKYELNISAISLPTTTILSPTFRYEVFVVLETLPLIRLTLFHICFGLLILLFMVL